MILPSRMSIILRPKLITHGAVRMLASPGGAVAWASADLGGAAQIGDDLVGERGGGFGSGIQHQLGGKRGFVRVIDTGEAADLAGAGLFVEAFWVARLTYIQRGSHVDLQKIARFQRGPDRIPI